MFFITAFEDLDEEWGIKNSRCFGFYQVFEDAERATKENWRDINETIYNYVVIEEMNEGIHPYAQQRWFYKFDYDKRLYYAIIEPEEARRCCNFALG